MLLLRSPTWVVLVVMAFILTLGNPYLSSSTVSAAPLTDAYILVNNVMSEVYPYSRMLARFLERTMHGVRFAIDRINADPTILPNTTLHLKAYDNKDVGSRALRGINEAYDEHGNALVLVIIGASDFLLGAASMLCGALDVPVTITLKQAPEYGDRLLYPTNFRLLENGEGYGKAYGDLMDKYSWNRIAYFYERGMDLLEDMQGTSFFNRDISLFAVSANPTPSELTNALNSIREGEFRVVYINMNLGPYITLLAILQSLGLFGHFQLVTDPILSSLGIETLLRENSIPLSLLSGSIGMRMKEEFTTPQYLQFANEYLSYYLSSFTPDTPLYNLSGDITDFNNVPPRWYEALHYDTTYVMARALHTAFEDGIDGENINATTLLPYIYNHPTNGTLYNTV